MSAKRDIWTKSHESAQTASSMMEPCFHSQIFFNYSLYHFTKTLIQIQMVDQTRNLRQRVAVRPALSGGFPAVGDWRTRRGVPPVVATAVASGQDLYVSRLM